MGILVAVAVGAGIASPEGLVEGQSSRVTEENGWVIARH